MYRLTTTIPRTPRVRSTRLLPQIRRSSGSPTAGGAAPDHFTKTGEKEQDPAKVNMRSNEYSQSGGDDMVAGQTSASYDVRDEYDIGNGHADPQDRTQATIPPSQRPQPEKATQSIPWNSHLHHLTSPKRLKTPYARLLDVSGPNRCANERRRFRKARREKHLSIQDRA
jgi:hypothetical protein